MANPASLLFSSPKSDVQGGARRRKRIADAINLVYLAEEFTHSVFAVLVWRSRLPGMSSFIPGSSQAYKGMRRTLPLLPPCVVSLLIFLLAGCGSNSQPFNDTPAITNLFPSSAAAGGPSFTLNVTGTGFIAQSLVYWNNAQLTTSFNADTLQLSASVPASDIAGAGVAQVVVVSPAPGGGMSNATTFTINPASNAVPTIASLSPSSTAVGVLPPNSALLVNGTNFIQSSAVAFNGVSRAANFVGATQISVPLSSADVAANATISVTVFNPAPGGGVSNAVSFVVGTGHALRLKSAALAAGVSFPQIVSANANGGASNGQSSAPAIGAGGRFVAFYSTATNLVSGPSGNIFVRDTCLGVENCTPQTIAADLAADGSAPNGAAAASAAISADGRFVAFASRATNLLPETVAVPPGATQVYLRDLCAGPNAPIDCVPGTQLISSATGGAAANAPSASPSMSADGRYVAFVSSADNLSGGADAHGLFVRDTCAGPTAPSLCAPKTYAAPVTSAPSASGAVTAPAISAGGRYLTFVLGESSSPPISRILEADMCLGPDAPPSCQPSLIEVSVSADGSELAGASSAPSISADGRFVAFAWQKAGNAPQLFLRDNCLGASKAASCVPDTSLLAQNAAAPSISSSGRYVSYVAFSASIAPPASGASAAAVGALYIYDTCFGAGAACVPQATAVNGDPAVSSAAPFIADAARLAPMNADASFIVFSTSAAIPALPLGGLGDVLLSVTPF